MSDSVLITGAGSGLGMASALYLASRNYRVFGTVLTEAEDQALAAEAARRRLSIRAIAMDITRPSDIDRGVSTMLSEAGRIDALVHFAGMGLRGFFEDLGLDEIRRVYEVNVFGIMALTQAVLPHMRQQRAGRIIITSSAAGRMGSMGISGYCSSKFALEGFGECLAQEVFPFGIHVSLLEPGLVHTPHFTVNRNRARRAVDPSSPYYLWFCQHEHIVDKLLATNRFSPDDIAQVVYRILTARRPHLRYMVGAKAKLFTGLRNMIPGELFDRIYWTALRRMVTRPRVQASGLKND